MSFNHMCEICWQYFPRPSILLEHERSHTGQRPYHCTFYNCNKTYARKEYLTSHAKTHQSERDYQCTELLTGSHDTACGKAFHRKSDLTRHTRRVHGITHDQSTLSCQDNRSGSHNVQYGSPSDHELDLSLAGSTILLPAMPAELHASLAFQQLPPHDPFSTGYQHMLPEDPFFSMTADVDSMLTHTTSSVSMTALLPQATDYGREPSSAEQETYQETFDLTGVDFTNSEVASKPCRRLRQEVCVWSMQPKSPFDGEAHHCWSSDMPPNSICRVPEYIKIVGEQSATDVDGYINVQRRKASPNFVMSIFQLRCSNPKQYHKSYEEFFDKFWCRGVYGVAAADSRGHPEDEIFLAPLHLNNEVRDPLRILMSEHQVGPRDSAIFLFIRQRVARVHQGSPSSGGSESFSDLNPWWWTQQPIQNEVMEDQSSAPAELPAGSDDCVAIRPEETWYVAPRNLNHSTFVW